MDERDASEGAQSPPVTEARRWPLRLLAIAVVALAIGPIYVGRKELLEPLGLANLYLNFLLPSVPIYLGATLLLHRRSALLGLMLLSAGLLIMTLSAGKGAVAYTHYVGWIPVVWAALLASFQLGFIVAAGRCWSAATSDGAARYGAVLAAMLVPYAFWSFSAPMHGWVGHRSATNESAAIGDIRTMLSAQTTYHSAQGHYGSPQCLAEPARCIPDYPAEAPVFLDPALAETSLIRAGYRRVFHAGPEVFREGEPPGSRLRSYAYVAVPLVPTETGHRGFCGDSTARLCFTGDGSAPAASEGLCPEDCESLY